MAHTCMNFILHQFCPFWKLYFIFSLMHFCWLLVLWRYFKVWILTYYLIYYKMWIYKCIKELGTNLSFPQLSTHDCQIIKHFWAFDVQRLELCIKPLWHTHTKEASSKKTVLSCLCEILSVSLTWEFLPVDFLMLSAGDGANTEILSGFLSRPGPAPQPSIWCWRGIHTPVPTSSLADVQRPRRWGSVG